MNCRNMIVTVSIDVGSIQVSILLIIEEILVNFENNVRYKCLHYLNKLVPGIL